MLDKPGAYASSTIPKDAADFLLELGRGEHAEGVRKVQAVLRMIGWFWPPALAIARGLSLFVFINKWSTPTVIMPDGRGGFVATTHSRFDPATGRFIKWGGERQHWIYDDFIGGVVPGTVRVSPPP